MFCFHTNNLFMIIIFIDLKFLIFNSLVIMWKLTVPVFQESIP